MIKFIAEICGNHLGSLDKAKQMIDVASSARCWAVKGQMRNIEEQAKRQPDLYNKPHPNPANSFGKLYKDHRKFLEFSKEQHVELKEYAENLGMKYFVSTWDIQSAQLAVEELRMGIIKIPSACNADHEMLQYLINKDIQLHISFGMTTPQEIYKIMMSLEWYKMPDLKDNTIPKIVIYHCSSAYPCPFENVYMLNISKLRNTYSNKCGIGFSSHTKGIAVENAALALGAEYFEKHITLDRTLAGTDQANSLEPAGLHKIIRDLNATLLTLKNKPGTLDVLETEQRRKLRGDI